MAPSRRRYNARAIGLDETGRGHVVWLARAARSCWPLMPSVARSLVGDLDEDLLGLLAEDVDLLDTGYAQQPAGACPPPVEHQLPVRQALGLHGVEGEIDVRELVVEQGPITPRGRLEAWSESFLRAW